MSRIGVVLAAGASRRLRPYSDGLPKTLVPVADGVTPLDIILRNFRSSGISDVAIVVGYAADAVRARVADLERRYDVALELIDNDRAETWNNCYSLWCARGLFGRSVLLCNGDTLHAPAVESALLTSNVSAPLVLAVDTGKQLGDEEMKVVWSSDRGVEQITKLMDPDKAYGEYIGLATIDRSIGEALADALEATWRRDPSLYYEDGFAELIQRGAARIDVQPIGDQPWIEIDDHADLARAADVLKVII